MIVKLGIEKIDKIEKKPTLLPSILKIDKDNAIHVKIVKGLFRIPFTPLATIFDPIYKRLRKTEQGAALKKRHKESKKQALENVAKKKIDLLSENIKKNFQERLVQEGGSMRGVVDNDRDKIIDNRRNRETDDIAIALREIEKRTKKELEKREGDYIEKNLNLGFRGNLRNRYTTSFLKKQEIKRLKKEFKDSIKTDNSNDPNESVLERLIKREYALGGKDFTLKYAQELANNGDVIDMKKALFENANQTFTGNLDFKDAFEKAVIVASDSATSIDPNAVPTTSNNVNPAKDDPKSNFDKNRKIATIIHDSIVNAEFNNLKNKFHIPVLDPNAEVIPTGRKKGRAVIKMETVEEEENEEDE